MPLGRGRSGRRRAAGRRGRSRGRGRAPSARPGGAAPDPAARRAPLRRVVQQVPDRARAARDAADRRRLELRLDADGLPCGEFARPRSRRACPARPARAGRPRSARGRAGPRPAPSAPRPGSGFPEHARAPRARRLGAQEDLDVRAQDRQRRARLVRASATSRVCARSESSSALSIERSSSRGGRARRGHRGWRCARSGLGSPSHARRSRSAGSPGPPPRGRSAARAARRARCRRSRSPPGARRPGRVWSTSPSGRAICTATPSTSWSVKIRTCSSSVASEKNGPRVPAATAAAPCDGRHLGVAEVEDGASGGHDLGT